MSSRVIAAFVLLPLAVGVERLAWYGARMALHLRLSEAGAHELFTTTGPAVMYGGIVAGAVAALFLPRVVLVAAGLLSAAGYILASVADDPSAIVWGVRFAAAGAGALKACLYGLALVVMPTPKLRTLYIVLTYLVVNAAAFVASFAGGFLADHFGVREVIAAAGALLLVGLVPATIVIVVDKLSSPPSQPTADPGRAVLAAGAMVFATAPLFAAMSWGARRLYDVGASASHASVVQGTGTLVTMAALCGIGAWLLTKTEPPSLSFLVGAGLAAGAAAALIAVPSTFMTAAFSSLLFAVAEIAAPLALARGLANQHRRAATLVAGFMLALSWASSSSSVGEVDPRLVLFVLSALCAVGAGVLLTLGKRFDAWLDAPMVEERTSFLNPVS